MSTNAVTGLGAAIYYSADGVTYTKLANEALDLQGPSRSRAQIEVTHMDSTEKEFIAALPDPGQFSCSFNYYKVSLATIVSLHGTVRYWRFLFKEGSKWEGQGYISDYTQQTPVHGAMTIDVTWQLTGAWNYTQG